MDHLLRETEECHGRIGRYTCPDEHAFFPGVGAILVIPPPSYTFPLREDLHSININPTIKSMYLTKLIPGITREGDDNQYGSTAVSDVACLQALSHRIHYGKKVAEAKFQSNPEAFKQLILDGDAAGILAKLTCPDQENRVARRVRYKAAVFGRDLDGEGDGGMQENGQPSDKLKL